MYIKDGYQMKDRTREKIGIFGGTFDPIHNGHLFIAQTALEEAKLHRIVFVPSGHPPHKKNQYVTESGHRLAMLRQAIQSNPYFECSTCEVESKDIGYTYTLLKKMRQQKPRDDFYFIMGADSFMDIKNWYRYKELLTLVELIVMKRKGFDESLLNQQISSLEQLNNHRITILDSPKLEISSSDIRNRILLRKSIKYLVPEPVEIYIKNQYLYKKEQECL